MTNISLPKLGKFDLSSCRLPAVKLPNLTSYDLTKVDLAKFDPKALTRIPAVRTATEIATTAVGLVVVNVEKANARGREILARIVARPATPAETAK